MSQQREPIRQMIARSSLGTPVARKLRARTPVSVRTQILHRASTNSAGNRRSRD
jgi:hypothetical protein